MYELEKMFGRSMRLESPD